jgi:hypothetical protein
MPHEWEDHDDELAAGAICPMPDCVALVCGRCGIEFVVPEDELVFQSVPKDWLLARVNVA